LFLICFTDFFLDALQKEKFNFLVTYQLNAKLKDNFLDAIRLQKKKKCTYRSFFVFHFPFILDFFKIIIRIVF